MRSFRARVLTRRFRPNWPGFLARGRLGIDDRAAFWVGQAAELREPILARGCRHGSAVHQTHNAIGRELCRNGRIMRYTNDDGFGAPETAFLVYNFWYVDALAVIGRRDEARVLFIDLLDHRNPFGLLSEDIHPETAALWGNIPQTY
jgi:hypothetical protein